MTHDPEHNLIEPHLLLVFYHHVLSLVHIHYPFKKLSFLFALQQLIYINSVWYAQSIELHIEWLASDGGKMLGDGGERSGREGLVVEIDLVVVDADLGSVLGGSAVILGLHTY